MSACTPGEDSGCSATGRICEKHGNQVLEDTSKLRTENAELRAALERIQEGGVEESCGKWQPVNWARRALKSDLSRASGSSDGSALGDVLRAAEENERADAAALALPEGKERLKAVEVLCEKRRTLFEAVRRYRKERGDG